jgi:hypothetical protein
LRYGRYFPDLGYCLPVFIKLAAVLYGRTRVSWTTAIAFVLLYYVVASVVAVIGLILLYLTAKLNPGYGGPRPELFFVLAVLIDLALRLGIGGSFFASRATTAAGEPLKFKRAATLSLIAYFPSALLAVLLIMFYGRR